MRQRSWERMSWAINATLAIAMAVRLVVDWVGGAELWTTDFTVFRTGWWLALHDAHRLYDPAAQAVVEDGLIRALGGPTSVGRLLAFLHPPHMALAGCWLEWVAARWNGKAAFLLWAGFNVALLARLIVLFREHARLERGQTIFVAVALAAFSPVFLTLTEGQLSLLLAVAAFNFVWAVADRRAAAAAGSLLILSFKPPLLPPLLAVLVARREWRVLAGAAGLGAVVVLGTGAILGHGVWLEYARHVRSLERAFAGGLPAGMPNLRGFLARLAPDAWRGIVDAIAVCGWLGGAAAAGLVAAASRRSAVDDPRGDLSLALALGLLLSPHLYQHDLVLWVVPLAFVLAAARADPALWRRRVRVLLLWPIWFVVGMVERDLSWRLPIDPLLIPIVMTLVWVVRALRPVSAPGEASP
jgi:glycosyl transferase family 87